MTPADNKQQPQWLTYQEAADLLGCSTKTIQRRVRTGQLKVHYRPSRRDTPVLAADEVETLLIPEPAGAPE